MVHSVFVIGVGGQGVITLGKILAIAGKLAGYNIIGYENKGGAQRGGKVSSLVRLYKSEERNSISARIAKGMIDTVFSMDLYETARYTHMYTENTSIISNKSAIIPPLARNETIHELSVGELEKVLGRITPKLYIKNFIKAAVKQSSLVDSNLILLGWALRNDIVFIKQDYILKAVEQVLGQLGVQRLIKFIEEEI